MSEPIPDVVLDLLALSPDELIEAARTYGVSFNEAADALAKNAQLLAAVN